FILVDDGTPRRRQHCDETVVVFRARDRRSAFRRALALGRTRDHEYKNVYGQRVHWAFVEISTLDEIGSRIDGAEVSSRLHYQIRAKPVSARASFHPEKSQPGMSAPCGVLGRRRQRNRSKAGANRGVA